MIEKRDGNQVGECVSGDADAVTAGLAEHLADDEQALFIPEAVESTRLDTPLHD